MNPFCATRWFKPALFSLLSFAAAQACGPEFFPDTFIRTARPDLPTQFVRGRLGILQPSFPRADLLVAYRYLSGGTLNREEQAGWHPTIPLPERVYDQPEEPPQQPAQEAPTYRGAWMLARKAYRDAPTDSVQPEAHIHVRTSQGYEYQSSFLNCGDDAFRSAAETLAARAAAWGKSSPYLLDWLHAQDKVFQNCGDASTAPSPAPAGSPVLLQQDRAYQAAAAQFYARSFPEAEASFLAISRDPSSPWQPGAGYLAARVLVRQAFFARSDIETQTDFDPQSMRAADRQLRAYLAGHPPPAWHSAAQALLALISIRVAPEQRTRELASLVSGPAHDPNYAQDLTDLLWELDRQTPAGLRAQPSLWDRVPDPAHPGSQRPVTSEEAEQGARARRQVAYAATAALRSLAPAVDWTLTLQSLDRGAAAHALARWRATHALPWLVAALQLASTGEGAAPEDLLQAASAVPETSPAWQTVTYLRAELLVRNGNSAGARTVLDALAARLAQAAPAEREPSTVNAVRQARMLAASTEADFLAAAPALLLLASSEESSAVSECVAVMKDPARHYNCAPSIAPEQLTNAGAAIFNQEAPLPLWLAAASAETLRPQLREAIALGGWTRAILLEDSAMTSAFLPLLPAPVREQASESSPLAPSMTLARNPGLQPYLNGGVQRAYSYDFVESFRDNWCYGERAESPSPPQPAPAAFLSAAERQRGAAEAQRLSTLRSVDVGRRLLREVTAHPEDPQGPEALFLVLRMIRYGCTDPAAPPSSLPANAAAAAGGGVGPFASVSTMPSEEAQQLFLLRRDASRLLRRRYAASPWTRKAAPFAG